MEIPTAMEGLDQSAIPDGDFCTSVLTIFTPTSHSNELYHHICTTIGAISQELTDNHVPLSPVAYFGAIVSSLERLSRAADSPSRSIDALVVLLSVVVGRVSSGVLARKRGVLLELVERVLCGGRVSEEGIVGGLKCVGCLLGVKGGGGDCWEDVSGSFGVLLGYVTDSDHKVRRQSHTCIRDVLQSFQGSSFLSSASKGFVNMLRKLLLFTGESKGAPAEKGAQEILHVLEALKETLPYMSLIYKTSILEYYKTLLGLRKPLVTRRITDSLNVLCLHRTVEVNPEALVEVLSSLAESNPVDETSADGLTFTARLLDAGMRKVYNINRGICIVKLPLIFNSLQDVFGSGFEAAKLAATEAMKNLIQACIDEELIKEGVDRIKAASSDLNDKKTAPSIIEKVCAIVGSLIDNRYRDEWDMSFQVVSLMFDKLGGSSCILMKGTLENLANIEKESDENFSERKQLQECVGSALGAMGPEVFLSIIPLKLQADVSEINDWLFPILKQHTIGARLAYYVESLLGKVDFLKQKCHKLKQEGRIQSSRVVDSVIYHIWSLLPAFCNYSSDTAESFNLLMEVLRIALVEEPDLHGIICSALQILIQQNECALEGTCYSQSDKLTHSSERAITRYNKDVASANLAVMRSSARDLFSALSEVYRESTTDPGGSLLATIGEFASIADRSVVSKNFRTTMKELLKVTEDAGKTENSKSSMQIDKSSSDDNSLSQRAQLLDLAVSLLPGLDNKEINLLYYVTKLSLKNTDGLIQKKAYKVLSLVLKNSDGFIASNFDDLIKLMNEVLLSCQFPAKRHRLDCVYHLIVYIPKVQDKAEQQKVDIIRGFLAEIVLALKEANKKTRNRAYDVLVQIGHAFEEEEARGNKGRLRHFFDMVAGGLITEPFNPHMISAAVKGLARLTYEFSDLLSAAYQLLPDSFLLLQMKNREIIKANLGLLKVLVAKSQSENLHNHLKVLVEGILTWPCDTKNHFKAKVKHLLEMLVKKCGLDAVKAVMPEEHMKLLTNIRKLKERREKKLASNSETGSYLSKATTSRRSEWGLTKIFSDFDEETSDVETFGGRRSMLSSKLKSRASSLRKTSKSGKTLSEDLLNQLEDEPLDLLDQQKTRLALRSRVNLKRKHDSDDEMEVDEDGRLIILEEGKQKTEKSTDDDSDDDKSEVSKFAPRISKKVEKRRKTSESGWAYTGNEYASKKARGDVKKKGKYEPYAYWPLDRKMLSRRPEHRASARRGMSSVVKMTKSLEGKSVANALAVKGTKSKKKVHHKKR